MGVVKRWSTGDKERKLLAAMILNDAVLGRIAASWKEGGLFASEDCNRIGGWCVAHYRKQGNAPGSGLESYFQKWVDRHPNQADAQQLVEKLLVGISEEYAGQEFNVGLVMDDADRHFNSVKLHKANAGMDAALKAGDLEQAEALLQEAARGRIEVAATSAIMPFDDPSHFIAAYSRDTRDPLVCYPDAAGEFFGDQLGRDCLVGFMAPEKGNKSWFLLDVAYRAKLQRRKVAYFQVGDLSQAQILDRLAVRELCHPSRSTNDDRSWPCKVRVPTRIKHPPAKGECALVDFDEREYACPLDQTAGWAERIVRNSRRRCRNERAFRLSCHPTRSISAVGVRSELQRWKLIDDWSPDVVVIDYADILAPVNAKEDPIHQIKTTWELLSQLRSELHCLVVTATQVNAKSYGKRTLDRSNFAGNHLKHAEVTGMVSINMTAEEKDSQVCRLSWVMRREGHYSNERSVHLATCLAVANPCVRSCW